MFSSNVVASLSDVLEDQLNIFWRRHISTLPTRLLTIIDATTFRPALRNTLQKILSGKVFPHYNSSVGYALDEVLIDRWCADYEQAREVPKKIRAELTDYIIQNRASVLARCETNANARKSLGIYIDDPEAFLKALEGKATTQYSIKLFGDLIARIEAQNAASEGSLVMLKDIKNHLCNLAISVVVPGVEAALKRTNTLGYDHLIANLHKALHTGPPATEGLIQKMRSRYKAVFIDEFQDTDRLQFEIFQKAFEHDTILFFIGDPKQSIYGFRSADIFTYFEARAWVQHRYSMNVNYRSSKRFIAAMNRFFLPVPSFDTFAFGEAADTLSYQSVESPARNNKGELQFQNAPEPVLTLTPCKNKDEVFSALAADVASLLCSPDHQIMTAGGPRPIAPSDIGILIRANKDAEVIISKLAAYGIPAISIAENRVLQSPEAQTVIHILQALAAPTRSSINRALLSDITPFARPQVLMFNDEETLARVVRCRSEWDTKGPYTSLHSFLAAFGVRQHLLGPDNPFGPRRLTNLLQIIELVHRQATRRKLSLVQTISWLTRASSSDDNEGDEYEQRIESDETAVNIITIHKSKGLEYPIVFLPSLQESKKTRKDELLTFRDPDTSQHIFVDEAVATEAQRSEYFKQQKQEAARLIYVGVTRAIYKAFVYLRDHSDFKEAHLGTIKKALDENPVSDDLIEMRTELPEGDYPKFPRPQVASRAPLAVPRVQLRDSYWQRLSYTGLTPVHAFVSLPPALLSGQGPQYDHFILAELRRGSRTGDLLHFIFEHVSFTSAAHREKLIKSAIDRHAPGFEDRYAAGLLQMVEQVVEASIPAQPRSFSLNGIRQGERLSELSFDFPLAFFAVSRLQALSSPAHPFHIRQPEGRPDAALGGMMTGTIDLFFRHEGKYYVLDWKSNYLGDSLEAYQQDALAAIMERENYNLQYLIYCVAVYKYLNARLPDFSYEEHFGGVVYMFVRGVRAGSSSGIYYTRPSAALIASMLALY
jgi:exodeoxyribonuclease V beta subunit